MIKNVYSSINLAYLSLPKLGWQKKVMGAKRTDFLLLLLQLFHLGLGENCLPQHIVYPWGQLPPCPLPQIMPLHQGKLYRLHSKNQWPPNLPDLKHLTTMCGVQCFRHFTNFVQSQRPFRSKRCTVTYLGWLAADNDQQSYQRLWRLNECVSVGGWHFQHTMLTLYKNMLSELFAVS